MFRTCLGAEGMLLGEGREDQEGHGHLIRRRASAAQQNETKTTHGECVCVGVCGARVRACVASRA
jgi:hypothetical protein